MCGKIPLQKDLHSNFILVCMISKMYLCIKVKVLIIMQENDPISVLLWPLYNVAALISVLHFKYFKYVGT